MKKVLIIEDEPNIRELVLYNLKTNGYEGLEAEDGYMGVTMIHKEKPDLVLLDIMLPGKNGYDICKELRREGNQTPVIMLTAKTEEMDKVLGLEYGADDYISKPFGIRELMARIKAVLRRYDHMQDEQPQQERILQIGEVEINIERHQVKANGQYVDLTLKEFELLCYLAENRGHVLTRDQLLDKVWGIEYGGETRTVDVHIRHLRRKLEQEGEKEPFIETVRGKGYKLK